MCMAIQQHMAPRVIKIQQFVGKPIQVYNSIIAGCKQSVPMTRVYFLRGMPEVNKPGPKPDEVVGKSRLYVDDCAQSAKDPIASRFYNKLGNSFMKFNKLRLRLKLGLSDKGNVCCSDFPIAKLLQKEININWKVFFIRFPKMLVTLVSAILLVSRGLLRSSSKSLMEPKVATIK